MIVTGMAAYGASHLLRAVVNSNRSAVPTPSKEDAFHTIEGVSIRREKLDIGRVWEANDYYHTLVLENPQPVAVAIRQFVTSCDCTSVEPQSLTIPAGQSREVRVRIDLTKRSPFQMGQSERALAVTLGPVLEGKGVAASAWQVTGTVQSRVVLDSHLLQLGTLCQRGNAPVTRKLGAKLHDPHVILSARVTPPFAAAVVAKVPGGDDTAFEVRVTPRNDLPLGPFRFTVATSVTDAAGVEFPGPSVDVGGEMMPNRSVSPSQIYFDECPLGDKLTSEVTVDGGANVRQVTHNSPDLTVAKKETGDQARVYTITQRVTALGDQSNVAAFRVVQTDGSEVDCNVTVRYFGIAAKGAR